MECAGAVKPKKTVAAAGSAFVLPVLVSGASGGVSSGAAYGVNVAAAGEAVTLRQLPGSTPEPSHCLPFSRRSLQNPQSCPAPTAGRTESVGPVKPACDGWTVASVTSAATSPNLEAATRSARSVVGASACSLL